LKPRICLNGSLHPAQHTHFGALHIDLDESYRMNTLAFDKGIDRDHWHLHRVAHQGIGSDPVIPMMPGV